jgi:hypothetical protein
MSSWQEKHAQREAGFEEQSPEEMSRLCIEVLRSLPKSDMRRAELERLISAIQTCIREGNPHAKQIALRSRLSKLLEDCRGYYQ